jgi:hypothetical protein
VTAGVAAILAQGRPSLSAAGLHGLLVGSAKRSDLDPASSGAGLVDLRTAIQQEVYAEPSVVSFGTARGAFEIERSVRVHNVSTRPVVVTIGRAALAPKGVEITIDPLRVRLRPGGSAGVTVRADTRDLSDEAGIATGELVLRVAGSPEVHAPWAIAVPRQAELLSDLEVTGTGPRVSEATPAILTLVVGAVGAAADPQVRPIGLLEIELWRGGERLGLLARRRELLPGRYTFGLTGRAPDGSRLRRGRYVLRVVAVPGDGTRRQSATVGYRVR